MSLQHEMVLVMDFGGQYSQLIARRIRECGVYCEIVSFHTTLKKIKELRPKGIVFSGGPSSVYDEGAPCCDVGIFELAIPVLGICYGMQLLAYKLDGKVARPIGHREYGPARVELDTKHPLFNKIRQKTEVWASHGDTVIKLPKNFRSVAVSGGIAAMSDKNNRVMGIQFHPEVVDTKEGKKILQNFLSLSGCKKDWNPINLIHQIQKEVLDTVGKDKKVVLGVSGGVDSTTLAKVLASVLKKRLVCVAIDTGGFRKNELMELKENTKSAKVRKLVVISAGKDFIKNISTTIDGEEKRAKFRTIYKKIFEEQIKKYNAGFIVQGTLATDIIESGKVGKSAMIKTHHNVGLSRKVKDLHPFGNLFKYEVRELAKALKLPSAVYERNPFPGPGLFLRVVGTPVSKENIELVNNGRGLEGTHGALGARARRRLRGPSSASSIFRRAWAAIP